MGVGRFKTDITWITDAGNWVPIAAAFRWFGRLLPLLVVPWLSALVEPSSVA